MMKTYDAVEQAYKNGQTDGYKVGKNEAVYSIISTLEAAFGNNCACGAKIFSKYKYCPYCGRKQEEK